MTLGAFRYSWLSGFVFALLGLLAEPAEAAQPSQSGALTGIVTDGSGTAAVPGITVTLLRDGTGVATAVTDERGAFTFSDLQAGTYEVRASTGDDTSLANAAATSWWSTDLALMA